MAPPSAPRLDPVKVIFVDIPANVAVADTFLPNTTNFHDFLAALCTLSGSVVDKLGDFPRIRVPEQGFTLDEGCWWYRIVNQAKSRNGDNVSPVKMQKSVWSRLDNEYGYDTLVGQMSLGVTTQGGWVEVQHNLQKLRDDASANEALQCDASWQQNQIMADSVQSPALKDAYTGPVIVNGARPDLESATIQYNQLQPVAAPSDLEKFPDMEMLDAGYPYVLDQLSMLQQPFPDQLQSHHSQLNQQYQQQPARYPHQPQNGSHNTHQQRAFSHGQSYYSQTRGGHQSYSYDQNRNPNQNGRQNNNPGYHGNARGRGRGAGMPSYKQRPAPHTAQVGTPTAEAHAQWVLQHQAEQDELNAKIAALETEQEANYHTSFQTGSPVSGGRTRSKAHGKRGQDQQDQEEYLGAQEGNGQVQKNHSELLGSQSESFGTFPRLLQRMQSGGVHNTYGSQNTQFQNHGNGYQGSQYLGFDNQQENSGLLPSFDLTDPTTWSSNSHFPQNSYGNVSARQDSRSGSNTPMLSTMQFPTNSEGVYPGNHFSQGHDQYPAIWSSDGFPDYSSEMHDFRNPNRGMNENTDMMKESEIDALAASQASINPPSRALSAASSTRQFSNNLPLLSQPTYASMRPSSVMVNSYGQPVDFYGQPYAPRPRQYYNNGTMAATWDSADDFNAQLHARIHPQHGTASGEWNPSVIDYRLRNGNNNWNGANPGVIDRRFRNGNGNRNGSQTSGQSSIIDHRIRGGNWTSHNNNVAFRSSNHNIAAGNKGSKNAGNNEGEKKAQKKKNKNKKEGSIKHQKLKLNVNFPQLNQNGVPPVGHFSPPKPRDVREEKAKKVFEIQEEDNMEGSDGRGFMTADVTSNPSMRTNDRGSVDFSAGAKRNKPGGKTMNNIKFGFTEDEIDDKRDSDSELSELSRSPSLSPTSLITSSPVGGSASVASYASQTPLDVAAKRLRTKAANRAKEALLAEKLTKTKEVKVERQNESRAVRAKKRASEKWAGEDGDEPGEGERGV